LRTGFISSRRLVYAASEILTSQTNKSLAQEGAQAPYIDIQHVAEISETASGKAPLIKAYRP